MEITPPVRRIWESLAAGVPPGGTPHFRKWQQDVKSLGDEAPRVFIQALNEGDEAEQYTAILGLRSFGYDAYGDGYGPSTIFKYKAPGSSEWTIVFPHFPPDDEDLWR
jgi:hypothetical protein